MNIIASTNPTVIDQAVTTLQAGGLVVAPSDTVYGVLADCENPAAIEKLLRYKRRPAGKAISVATSDQKMAEKYVTLNDQARDLYQTFLPGAVTVVSASRHLADKRLESEFGTLGIRLPAHPLWRQITTRLGRGVTATSANSAGRKTPYSLADIFNHLSDRQKSLISLVIDGGQLPPTPPSLVIDTTATTPIVMRQNVNFEQFSSRDTRRFVSHSLDETYRLSGQILMPYLATIHRQGLLVSLDGDMGNGKTAFITGLARFLGISEPITSPTYTYLKQYSFKKFDQNGTLHHLDLWSIDDPTLVKALDLPSFCGPDNLICIEWYTPLAAYLPTHLPRLAVKIDADPRRPDERQISVRFISP